MCRRLIWGRARERQKKGRGRQRRSSDHNAGLTSVKGEGEGGACGRILTPVQVVSARSRGAPELSCAGGLAELQDPRWARSLDQLRKKVAHRNSAADP